jgi:2-furoyl-CoA dehydrogenase FAD binding subunit
VKPAPFAYARPSTLAQALDVLARMGSDARVLAGGQSLAAMLNMRLVTPALLLDINRIAGLDEIAVASDVVVTGATVRQVDALNSAVVREAVPLLSRALPLVGHYQTRNRGTLCGSIAHADPAAELPLALLVLGGQIELASTSGRRRVAAETFFRSALTTTRGPQEIVTALRWPRRRPRAGYAFREFSVRHGDYAIVAAACRVQLDGKGRIEDLALGLGGVGERPILVETTPFDGAALERDVAAEAGAAAARAGEPHNDLQASAAYRRHLAGSLGRSVVAEALAQAVGSQHAADVSL